jgi:hypothetical protein
MVAPRSTAEPGKAQWKLSRCYCVVAMRVNCSRSRTLITALHRSGGAFTDLDLETPATIMRVSQDCFSKRARVRGLVLSRRLRRSRRSSLVGDARCKRGIHD